MSLLDKDPDASCAPPAPSGNVLSDEQQAVLDAPLKVGEPLRVFAFAGAGKTSTLVAHAHSRPHWTGLYLAFNKSVEQEAKLRFPSHITPKTVHAFAYGQVGRQYKDIKGNLKAWELQKFLGCPLYTASIISKSLDVFLNSGEPVPTEEMVHEDVLAKLGTTYKAGIVDAVDKVFEAMVAKKLPMTHGGYLKLYELSAPYLDYDVIYLDEAQDTNPVTWSLLKRQLKRGTRLILVGDPFQQIYSWRGAVDAMEEVEGPKLYLTKSWRFGSAIAAYATKLLQSWWPDTPAIQGTAEPSQVNGAWPGHFDATVCRSNSGMFEAIVACETGVTVNGRQAFDDMLDQLEDMFLLSTKKGYPRSPALRRFQSWGALCDFAEDSLDDELSLRIKLVKDYGESLLEELGYVREKLMSMAPRKPLFTTCHKAKGLEWDSVILHRDFLPLYQPNGKPKEAVRRSVARDDDKHVNKEEINLQYVAATRAKKVLVAPKLPASTAHQHQELLNSPMDPDESIDQEEDIEPYPYDRPH